MRRFSRRAALGLLTAALPLGTLTSAEAALLLTYRGEVVKPENKLPGTTAWRPAGEGPRDADDPAPQIQGYASATSVPHGGKIDFHVAVGSPQRLTIAIYRLGWYAGDGARLMLTTEPLPGEVRSVPPADPVTGTIECHWPVTWSLSVPADWLSGVYLAAFVGADGQTGYTPFVVRDDRHLAQLCVVMPFSTYQAYNLWPRDGRRGKSLYYGYPAPGVPMSYESRAVRVSFDRPYSGIGWPKQFDRDHDFVQWVERLGYDVTYASTMDLHTGRLDPGRYRGLVFCGHDEYWTAEMRRATERAVDQGVSLAFLAANNVYWQIRLGQSSDGRANRVVTCYKTDPDPEPGLDGRVCTTKWRDVRPGGEDAEQRLLGVQYNGIIAAPQPLVVRGADHWFWGGCKVADGDLLPRLVGGEADGFDPAMPVPTGVDATVLSASPYPQRNGFWLEQNTHLYETSQGAVIFDAATLHWTLALNRRGFVNQKVQVATRNLFDRIVRQPSKASG
ncbi:hypothetical protein GCM10022225_13290 [Plantactinospora mayteni]|uniref:N,N-dimethylformamidase beta subunit-like C-terminal domain-containing protein n=1 Tax=Plantactinospora mayteni TaxID=566021 RepID=A0ABQ4EGQ9_9ACTN|nr:N,N-dimethylformamidase beta subunit family domain-containing protein [Plantactinospora mayteni]GIG93918.1 hypothetical protein Pma05_04910 [Plantactinospora mayteni]